MLSRLNRLHPFPTPCERTFRDPAVSGLLAQARPCAVSFYHSNEAIYAQGEASGPLYLVEYGAVRICRLTADGRRQISAFHFAGEIFGFEPRDEHQNYAESINRTGIRVLRPNSDEGLADNVLAIALGALAGVQDHLVLLGRMNASEKMAAFLVDLHDRQDAERLVDLPMQRNDIADYLGLTFETVSRVLRSLKEAGMVRLHSVSQVEILNLTALRCLAD